MTTAQHTLEALRDLYLAVIVGGEPASAVPGKELGPAETGYPSCALCGRPEFLDCSEDCAAELAQAAIAKAEKG